VAKLAVPGVRFLAGIGRTQDRGDGETGALLTEDMSEVSYAVEGFWLNVDHDERDAQAVIRALRNLGFG
jgi:hypothetical protein